MRQTEWLVAVVGVTASTVGLALTLEGTMPVEFACAKFCFSAAIVSFGAGYWTWLRESSRPRAISASFGALLAAAAFIGLPCVWLWVDVRASAEQFRKDMAPTPSDPVPAPAHEEREILPFTPAELSSMISKGADPKLYIGHVLRVSGNIANIAPISGASDSDLLVTLEYVPFMTKPSVRLLFKHEWRESLTRMKLGDKIEATGTINELGEWSILLVDSHIEED
jgi:hypothetical protein